MDLTPRHRRLRRTDRVDEPTHPGRRAVLTGLCGVGAATLVVGTAGLAGAATTPSTADTLTVWRLATDWSEPRGPHGKTRLRSRASRNAAVNRYALTEDEALDLNLHRCSWAPAEPVTVCRSTWETMWAEHSRECTNPWNGRTVRLLDRRWVVAAGATDRWGKATGSCPTSEPGDTSSHPVPLPEVVPGPMTPASGIPATGGDAAAVALTAATDTPSGPTNTGSVGAAAVSEGSTETGRTGAADAGAAGRGPTSLALTGAGGGHLLPVGAALAAAGAALVALRRRTVASGTGTRTTAPGPGDRHIE